MTDKFLFLPSHSNSLPFVMNSSESDSSGVSMSSTLMSRSSGVSRKSSDSREPSLWSRDRFISGATSVRRLRWEDTARPPPPPGGLTLSEFGGAARAPGENQRWNGQQEWRQWGYCALSAIKKWHCDFEVLTGSVVGETAGGIHVPVLWQWSSERDRHKRQQEC